MKERGNYWFAYAKKENKGISTAGNMTAQIF